MDAAVVSKIQDHYMGAIGYLYMPSSGTLIRFPYTGDGKRSHHQATTDNAEELGISQDQLQMECDAFNDGIDLGRVNPAMFDRLPKGMATHDQYLTYTQQLVRGIYNSGVLEIDCFDLRGARAFLRDFEAHGGNVYNLILRIDTLTIRRVLNPTSLLISDDMDVINFIEKGTLRTHFIVGGFAEDEKDGLDITGKPSYEILSRNLLDDSFDISTK